MIEEFIRTYFMEILGTTIAAAAGYIGMVVKNLITRYLNNKTKRAIAKTVVQFVEQVYKDLHGEEKLNAALSAFAEMLAEQGITVSDLEMRILLEAALAEFNGAFDKGIAIDPAKAN